MKIKFCPKCENIMRRIKENKIQCSRCGFIHILDENEPLYSTKPRPELRKEIGYRSPIPLPGISGSGRESLPKDLDWNTRKKRDV